MEELIQRINKQYEDGDYASMLTTCADISAHVDGLNNVIAEVNSSNETLNAEIEALREENRQLKSANADLFLKATGTIRKDEEEPITAPDDFESKINVNEF